MTKRLSLATLLALVAVLGATRHGVRPRPERDPESEQRARHHLGDGRRVLVLFMQAGFLFLEIGFSRQKNVGAGVAKILVNLGIVTIAWWAVGYGIAGVRQQVLRHRRLPLPVQPGHRRGRGRRHRHGADAVRDAVLRGLAGDRLGDDAGADQVQRLRDLRGRVRGDHLPAGGARRLRRRPAVRRRRQAGDGLRRLVGGPPDRCGRRTRGAAAARSAQGQVRRRRQAAGDPGSLDADRRPRRADPLGRLVRVQRRLDVRHRRRRACSPRLR